MAKQQSARLGDASPGGERRPGLRALGAAASRIAAPIVGRRGGGMLASLKAEWTAIVGSELAASSWPETLGRDGALKLRVAPGFALELQHRAPLVIERINMFFGRGVIARLVFVQGPLPLACAAPRPPPPPLAPADERELDTRLGDIADPQLRAALASFGRLVLADRRG
jgi:hypothetical protein